MLRPGGRPAPGHPLGRRPVRRHPSRGLHGRGGRVAARPHARPERPHRRRRRPRADAGRDGCADAPARGRGLRARGDRADRPPPPRRPRGQPGRGADERLLRAGVGAGAGRRDGARRPRRRDAAAVVRRPRDRRRQLRAGPREAGGRRRDERRDRRTDRSAARPARARARRERPRPHAGGRRDAGRGALEPEADPARRDAGAGPRARDLRLGAPHPSGDDGARPRRPRPAPPGGRGGASGGTRRSAPRRAR